MLIINGTGMESNVPEGRSMKELVKSMKLGIVKKLFRSSVNIC